MAAVGGKEFPIPRKIMTSKNVAIYKADNNLCFWFIVGILEENVNFHTLNERHKVDLAKRNFKRFNPDLNWNTYTGVDVEKELVNFAQKLDKHFLFTLITKRKTNTSSNMTLERTKTQTLSSIF
jgi:hypothetical protein